MKKTAQRTSGKSTGKNAGRNLNTFLMILSILLLVAGLICLVIEPIKSWRRKQITNNALSLIESDITQNSGLTLESGAITYVVPRDRSEEHTSELQSPDHIV